MPNLQPIELAMIGLVLLFIVFFIFVVTMIVISAVRSRAALKQAGLDPMAAEAQIAGRLANSTVLAPTQPLEARLTELTDLRSRGVISEDEYQTARSRALSSE